MTQGMTTDAPETLFTDNAQPSGNEEQSQTQQPWYSSLGDDYKNHPSIQKFSDANGLAKSYLSLESMMGQDKIPVPKDDNDTQAWQIYNKAFGVPENADKYELKTPENFGDIGDLKDFKEIMLKRRIPQKEAQGILEDYLGALDAMKQGQIQKFNEQSAQTSKELRAEWGLKYDENINSAKNFLEKMSGNKEEFDYFNNKIGNDPMFVKLLAKMGGSISEGSLGGLEGQGGNSFTKTPADAKAALDKILNDPTDAYWAGSKNKRNDMSWCKQHNLTYVSETERKARVAHVQSLLQMNQG